eukprot:8661362-Alexandrium_andersonii.AAC.1
MEEAVSPSRPAGRSVLVPSSESVDVGDHSVAVRAKRSTPGAQRRDLGVTDFRRFREQDNNVSPCGP